MPGGLAGFAHLAHVAGKPVDPGHLVSHYSPPPIPPWVFYEGVDAATMMDISGENRSEGDGLGGIAPRWTADLSAGEV
jgi:hypothetical protein